MNFNLKKLFFGLFLSTVFLKMSYAEESIQNLNKIKLKTSEVQNLFNKITHEMPNSDDGKPVPSLSYKVNINSTEFIFLLTDNIPAPSPDEFSQCAIHILNSDAMELDVETIPCSYVNSITFFKNTMDSSNWFSICVGSADLKNNKLNYCAGFKQDRHATGLFNYDDKLNDYLVNNNVKNFVQFKKFFSQYFEMRAKE